MRWSSLSNRDVFLLHRRLNNSITITSTLSSINNISILNNNIIVNLTIPIRIINTKTVFLPHSKTSLLPNKITTSLNRHNPILCPQGHNTLPKIHPISLTSSCRKPSVKLMLKLLPRLSSNPLTRVILMTTTDPPRQVARASVRRCSRSTSRSLLSNPARRRNPSASPHPRRVRIHCPSISRKSANQACLLLRSASTRNLYNHRLSRGCSPWKQFDRRINRPNPSPVHPQGRQRRTERWKHTSRYRLRRRIGLRYRL